MLYIILIAVAIIIAHILIVAVEDVHAVTLSRVNGMEDVSAVTESSI